MTEVSDEDIGRLLAELADGNRAVFTEVFQALWPKIQRLCERMLGNPADAADAAQQALMKVLTRSADYDRSKPGLPWALGIAAWECRTLRRKKSRSREVATEHVAEGPAAALEEEQIVQRELVEAALTSIGQLSPQDQEVLLATFWEEAASVQGATLRKRRERALSRLRETFRRLYGLD